MARWWGDPDPILAEISGRSRRTDAVILAGSRCVGYVCWQPIPEDERIEAGLIDLPRDLVDIDIAIGEQEFRGRGIGPRALALVLTRLFGEGVQFAGLGTSTTNHRAIRAFSKAGFRPHADFDDPDIGPCTYLVARTRNAVDLEVGGSGSLPGQ